MAIHQINPTSRELPASQKVQCHSALCLQSGHTQQRVHFAMTVFTSGIHKCSSLQALLRKRDQTSLDPQNIDWFTLLCYLQNLGSFPGCHFVDFFFLLMLNILHSTCSIWSMNYFSPHVIIHSFSYEHEAVKLGSKCSWEDTNAIISTLKTHNNTHNYILKIHENKQVYQTFN